MCAALGVPAMAGGVAPAGAPLPIHTPAHPCHLLRRPLKPPLPASLPPATPPCPQALASNTGLQSLLLDTNALGDEGAAMLATVRRLFCFSRPSRRAAAMLLARCGRTAPGSLLLPAYLPACLPRCAAPGSPAPPVPLRCRAGAGWRQPHHHPQPVIQQHWGRGRQGARRDAQGARCCCFCCCGCCGWLWRCCRRRRRSSSSSSSTCPPACVVPTPGAWVQTHTTLEAHS